MVEETQVYFTDFLSVRMIGLLLGFHFSICLFGQYDSKNIDLLGHKSYPNYQMSDVWGYSVDSKEYAIATTTHGVSIVDVSEPSNLEEIQFIPGPITKWRDAAIHEGYCYVSNDNGGDGVLIIDLANLGTQDTLIWKYWIDEEVPSEIAHNIWVADGYLYLFGHDVENQGTLIYDLQDPEDPVYVASINERYTHDGFVRNDTLWTADINEGYLTMYDVKDKRQIIKMGEVMTPDLFAHAVWPSDNGQYAYVCEERSGSPLTVYDVSNPGNMVELDRYYSTRSATVIPHNVHYLNGYLYNSYYRDGITICDARNPKELVEVAFFDSCDSLSGDGFDGSWGVYPFLPSGNILLTDIQNGLFVLKPQISAARRKKLVFIDANNRNRLVGIGLSYKNEWKNTDLMGEAIVGQSQEEQYLDINVQLPSTMDTTIMVELLSDFSVDTIYLFLDEISGIKEKVDQYLPYPNPFKSEIKLPGKLPFTLYNGNGVIVKEGIDNNIDCHDLPAGLYILDCKSFISKLFK